MNKRHINANSRGELQKSLIDAIEWFQEIRDVEGDNGFRELLKQLGADDRIVASALLIVRYFNPNLTKFKVPTYRIWDNMAEAAALSYELNEATKNFKPGNKGKKGGMKRFHTPLKEERDFLVAQLRDYKNLRDREEKSGIEKERLQNYDETIPEDIRSKIHQIGVKTLAIEWMCKTYPLKASTLIQIIRYKPQNRDIN